MLLSNARERVVVVVVVFAAAVKMKRDLIAIASDYLASRYLISFYDRVDISSLEY